jgi:hypothetical protein
MATPTQKHPKIDALAHAMMGSSRTLSIENDVCVSCGGAANKFIDELSRREYRISGLC